MTRVAIRGLFARRLRLFLTLLAVALGVSLIAATYVFTDTINKSFENIFTQTNKGTDASITPTKFLDNTDNGGTAPTVPASVLTTVKANPDVQVAEGGVFDTATILGKNGKRIGKGGAPNFVSSVSTVKRFEALDIQDGRFPQNADEAVIDLGTAKKQGFKIGDKVTVQGGAPRKDYTIVGTAKIAGVDSLGGAAIVGLQLPEAQRMLAKTGYDSISAAAKPGVSPAQLVASLRREIPSNTLTIRTGEAEARSQADDINNNLSFLKTFLLIFGFVALFVGAFIIFNSFSITVAQRTRELGLLRAIGASRRQVLANVLGEGFLLGFVGSALGLLIGFALAPGLKALFVAFGVDLPSQGLVIETRTILVPVIVGTVVAVLSSIVPAIRATRVSPMAALRESAAPTAGRVSRRLTAFALVLLVLGVALVALGLFGSGTENQHLTYLGVGVLATFMAVAFLSPRLVRPLAAFLGLPIQRLAGFPGRSARENAIRQPGRTAATAAALMIGVALVMFASVFASSVQATISGAVKHNLKGQFVVVNDDGFSPFSPQVLQAVDKVDGVDAVSGIRFSKSKVAGVGGDTAVSGIDPQSLAQLYKITVKKGPEDAITQLSNGTTAVVTKNWADDNDIDVGDTLRITTPRRKVLTIKVAGVVDDKGGLIAPVSLDNAILERDFGEPKDAFGLVGTAAGANTDTVQQSIKTLLKNEFPEAKVQTAQQFIDDQASQINQVLGLIYALLSLAVIISLFGIVNTLVLSISERTREFGMLRAIGTTQRQVRKIVRWEAVITAMIGGILGVVLGLALSVLFTRPLDGFTLSIPWGSIVILLILAGVAGVLAAAWPARRAAKLDVLKALAYE